MTTLLATGAILVSWAVCGAVLFGLGRVVRQVVARKRRVDHLRLSDLWIGLAVLIVWLQVWNFFAPVDAFSWLPLVALAAPGLSGGAARLRRPARATVLFGGIFAVAAVWLANLAIEGPLHIDSAGYHLSMLQWVQDYAVVPGLANLHTRLGYNSSEFLYVAAMGAGPWQGQGYHVANGLLLLAMLAEVVAALYRVTRYRAPRIPDLVLVVVASAVVDHFVNGYQLTSPAPDLGAFVVSIMMAVYLMRAVDRGGTGSDWAAAVCLIAVGPVLRVQLLPMAALCVVILLVAYWRRASNAWRPRPWMLAPAGGFLALAWGTWIGRGLVLSGYPLFPSAVAGIDVDWQVPAEMARAESATIRAYARNPSGTPDQVLGNWNWLESWWRPAIDHPDLRYPLAILGLSLVLALAALVLRLTWQPSYSAYVAAAALLPVSVATVVWFFTAPDPRFNSGPFWAGAAAALCLVATSFRWRWAPSPWGVATLVVLGASGLLVGHSLLVLHRLGYTKPERAVGDGVLGTISAPTSPLTVFTTLSGIRVNVPTDLRCWNAPQPCTPMPMGQLSQRGPDVSSGYTLRGAP